MQVSVSTSNFLCSDFKLIIIGDSDEEGASHIIASLHNYRITPTPLLEGSYRNLQNYLFRHFSNPRGESLGAAKMASGVTCGWEMDQSKYCYMFAPRTHTLACMYAGCYTGF